VAQRSIESSPVPAADATVPPEEAIPARLAGTWWVAHTRPRNEKALCADLGALGIFNYLPLKRRLTRSRRTGRISKSSIPLFPGYVFFNATEQERLRSLRTNRIVRTIPVPDQGQLITELRQIHRVLSAQTDLLCHPDLKAGDFVRVIAGPLEGLEGVVWGPASRLRLVLNVHMLGQSVSVQVSRDQIEPIEPPACEGPGRRDSEPRQRRNRRTR